MNYLYDVYTVVKPLPPEVEEGVTAPAFGQDGGGVQYYFPRGLQYYIDHGYITEP